MYMSCNFNDHLTVAWAVQMAYVTNFHSYMEQLTKSLLNWLEAE